MDFYPKTGHSEKATEWQAQEERQRERERQWKKECVENYDSGEQQKPVAKTSTVQKKLQK